MFLHFSCNVLIFNDLIYVISNNIYFVSLQTNFGKFGTNLIGGIPPPSAGDQAPVTSPKFFQNFFFDFPPLYMLTSVKSGVFVYMVIFHSYMLSYVLIYMQ